MITYEEALKAARAECPEIDYFVEFENAYSFSIENELTIGGPLPIVIMKDDGRWLGMTTYLVHENLGTDIVREGHID